MAVLASTLGVAAVAMLIGAVSPAAQGGGQGRQGGAGGPGRQGGPGGTREDGAATANNAFANAEVRSSRVQGNVWLLTAGGFNSVVQIGDEGVLVVDTMVEPLGDKLVAEIRRLAPGKPIRTIINTHVHADHMGGNVKVAAAGESVVGGNFAPQVGAGAANAAFIYAHENVQNRVSNPQGIDPKLPFPAWPTNTFFDDTKELYFNAEAVQMFHQPNAHTDGDIVIYFRKSDVVAAGDTFNTNTFPVISVAQGGSLNGVVNALNRIIDLTVPRDKQEGGTYVVPGHGRVTDEADVVDYRDMMTIIRDRFADAIKKKMTLEQVKAARLVRDYEPRYGATQGFWTTDAFVEAAYRSLSRPAGGASGR
jgi:glyoxylase-like metal-dependent hydrolase (beta-lactamase superfamily II)